MSGCSLAQQQTYHVSRSPCLSSSKKLGCFCPSRRGGIVVVVQTPVACDAAGSKLLFKLDGLLRERVLLISEKGIPKVIELLTGNLLHDDILCLSPAWRLVESRVPTPTPLGARIPRTFRTLKGPVNTGALHNNAGFIQRPWWQLQSLSSSAAARCLG
ncbi:hypothetical protein VTO42DRAFT_6567 [Malbranchea cinnamomea]